jgi:hypothetical protein
MIPLNLKLWTMDKYYKAKDFVSSKCHKEIVFERTIKMDSCTSILTMH